MANKLAIKISKLAQKLAPACPICKKRMRFGSRSGVQRVMTPARRRAHNKVAKKYGWASIPKKQPRHSPYCYFYCPASGKHPKEQSQAEVPMTKELIKMCRQYDREAEKRTSGMHKLWHLFTKTFKERDLGTWKYNQYDFMKRVDKFPGVTVVGCDDSHHTSSDIVLVPHETKDYYWGTSVVYIPQCSGDPPAELFLYGGHARALRDALNVILKKHKQKGERW